MRIIFTFHFPAPTIHSFANDLFYAPKQRRRRPCVLAYPPDKACLNIRAPQLPKTKLYENFQKCTLHSVIMYNYAGLRNINTHKYEDLLAKKSKEILVRCVLSVFLMTFSFLLRCSAQFTCYKTYIPSSFSTLE